MDRSSNGGTTQGQPIRGRQSGYVSRNYIYEDPSDSLEYSASDFAVAQFARAVGDTAKYNTYIDPRPVVAQRVQHRVELHPPPQRRRHLDLAARPGQRQRLHRGQRRPVHVDGHLQLRQPDQPHGRAEDRDPAPRPPLHRAQRRPDPAVLLHRQRARARRAVGVPLRGLPAGHQLGRPPGDERVVHDRAPAACPATTTSAPPRPGTCGRRSGMYPPTPGADVLALHGPLFPSITVTGRAGRSRSTAARPLSTCRA